MTRSFSFLAIYMLSAAFAHAHVGHVGELAGHAHWVGVAAVLGAAALSALAAKARKAADDAEEEALAEGEAEEQSEGAAP